MDSTDTIPFDEETWREIFEAMERERGGVPMVGARDDALVEDENFKGWMEGVRLFEKMADIVMYACGRDETASRLGATCYISSQALGW